MLANTNHPFFLTVDSSWIRVGGVLFQMNEKGKLDFILQFSQKCTTNEQKLCTTYRKLIGFVYSLTV